MDPELWELFERGDGGDEVAAILRLSQSGLVPEGVRIVAQLGEIVTVRMRRGAIPEVREDAHVTSIKSGGVAFGPDVERNEDAEEAAGEMRATDERRPADLATTGKGVIVGVVDWGFDFAHPDFRREDGSSRITALWDQRGAAGPQSPMPYGYGRLHTNQALNRALQSDDPYAALGYHPADMDPGSGAHGTHVASVAAGSGGAGGPLGIAPDAELVLVHSATWGRAANLGDSVTLLEAIDFILQTAGDKPCVINLSMGRHGGRHDGSTLVEQGLDAALRAAPGRAICQSTGNYFDRRIHAAGQLRPGTEHTLVWEIAARDATPNQLEVWYSWRDEMEIEIRSPDETITRRVKPGERATITLDGVEIGKVYHRIREPNTLDNHAAVFLYKDAPPGPWEVTLIASNVVDGRFHAWIERDAACPLCQSHFRVEDAVHSGTTGYICNGLRTIAVGAYDPHDPQQPVAHFSSAGPTRDGRIKPDLCAPGVSILAARSTPRVGEGPLLTRMSGTSMAAPHVTGTVALMFEVVPRRLRIEETHSLLLASTRPPPPEWAGRAGSGYLDIEAAVEAARALSGIGVASPPRESTAQQEFTATTDEESPMNEQTENPRESVCPHCATHFSQPSAEAESAWSPPPAPARQRPIFRADEALRSGRVVGSSARLLGEAFDAAGRSGIEHSAAALFDAFLAGLGAAGFDLIGAPGQRFAAEPQPGDILCRRGEGGLAHTALLAGSDFWPRELAEAAGLTPENYVPGIYAQVVEGGWWPHTSGDCFARRLTDAEGWIPADQMLLRPRAAALEYTETARPPLRRDPAYNRWIQESLNQVAAERLAVDGIVGPLTTGAVRRFQQQRGLVADGIVGPITERALVGAGAAEPPPVGAAPAGTIPPFAPVPPLAPMPPFTPVLPGVLPAILPVPVVPPPVPDSCAPFLPGNASAEYFAYIQPQTLGRITPLINGRSSGGSGPDIDLTEPLDAMQAAVTAIGAGDSVYLSAWFFDPATPLTAGAVGAARDWGSLFAAKAIAGAKIRLIINDFDPISGSDGWLQGSSLDPLNLIIGALPAGTRDNFKYIVSMHPAHVGALRSLLAGQGGRNINVASHHQKFMVVRRGEEMQAFCGGLDIEVRKAPVLWKYTGLIGWHDLHVKLEGPITRDLEKEFVMRWNREKANSTRRPLRGWAALETLALTPLSAADNAPAKRPHRVQMLRTISSDAFFSPFSTERDDVFLAYQRAINCSRDFLYLENQYYRSPQLADLIVLHGRRHPGLVVIIVVVASAAADDGTNVITLHGDHLQFTTLDRIVRGLGSARVRIYTMHHRAVHSKFLLADDTTMIVGSANANERSFRLDSELNIVTSEPALTASFRRRLWSHNLGATAATVSGWRTADFIPQWDAVAVRNASLPAQQMSGEGVVAFDFAAVRGQRHGSIPDEFAILDVAPEGGLFAGPIPPGQNAIALRDQPGAPVVA